jgi:WD40 repeat protein
MRCVAWSAIVAILIAAGPVLGQPKKPDVVAKLDGHLGGVAAIAYSGKGDRLATGSGNGVVRIWDAKTGELVARVDDDKHKTARVDHVAFSADGRYLSSSSRNIAGAWDLSDPKRIVLRYEDPYLPDPGKLGAVSGDGKLMYFTGTENNQPLLSSYSFGTRLIIKAELPAKLKPAAIASISDPGSALVALYCVTGEKNEAAGIALVGLGEPRVLGKDVPTPLEGQRVSISFAPDRSWLVVGNGSKVVYWRVPGSQVITGDAKSLPGSGHFVAAAGPRNVIAVASAPMGKKVAVSLYDVGGADPKRLAEYASGLDRISALAFSPDGSILAVGDDVDGVVQLWSLK